MHMRMFIIYPPAYEHNYSDSCLWCLYEFSWMLFVNELSSFGQQVWYEHQFLSPKLFSNVPKSIRGYARSKN